MEIEVLSKNKENFRFEISGINESEANTLRRIIISETPTLAIDEVEFIKNDSVLYDEIIANRLGLIPLVTDLKSYNSLEKCTCKNKGCTKCQAYISLDIKGPKTVYSSDLIFKDPKIKPSFEKIPIVKLLENQDIKFTATAKLGIGREHTKHSPALVFYVRKPILKINNNSKNLEKLKDKFPKQAFKDGKLNEKNLLQDNLYESCDQVSEDILKVDYKKDSFIFTIESFGQLEYKELFEASINSFNEKLDDLVKALKDLKPTAMKTLAKKLKG